MTFSRQKRIALASIIKREVRQRHRSINGVARELKISWTTANRLLQLDWNVEGERRARQSPPHVVKRRSEVVRLARGISGRDEYRRPTYPSAKAIARALHTMHGIVVSACTVRRDLRARGFVNRVRRIVPTKEARVEHSRLKFCRAMRRWGGVDLRRIVFSDEHWISINDHSCRTQWVRRALRGSDLCTRQVKRLQNVARVQLWAAVGHNYKGPLILFPQRGADDTAFRLTGDSYIRRCLSSVAPELAARKLILMQDGARPHVRASVKDYLRRKNVELLADWPPYSPDLNMIESLWAELNRRISARWPKNLDELMAAARAAWAEIPQDLINAHCARFVKKIAEVASNGGAA